MNRLLSIRQRIADLDRAHADLGATLEAENRAMTAEERTKVAAEKAELAALKSDEAFLVERQEAEKRQIAAAPSGLQMGADRAAAKPWGPTVAADAPAETRKVARAAGFGEWALAVRAACQGQGADPRLMAAASGMNSIIPSEGGFAVPPEFASGIERDMFAGGQLLSRVDARTISGDSIAYSVLNETSRASTRYGGVLGYWVEQGNAPTASKPALSRMELRLKKVGCLGYMTDELVADAAALGGELQAMFAEELIFQVEDAIYQGDGAGKPMGFTGAPCVVSVAKETGQVAATIVSANLSKMWARLPARSQPNAAWFVNVDCQPQLDELSIPAGTAALQPRFVNYGPDGILTIKGRPVIPVEYCATLGTQKDIALADLSRYRLIRKGGVEQASSIHVLFTTGEQTFRAFYRVDGQPVPRSSVTPFKGSGALSPFVILDTRS